MSEHNQQAPNDFIREIVTGDIAAGRCKVPHTRFPPEPNGYLHIGHAKSICLNFGIAREFGGTCNLRMDDTNPAKEELEYVESIVEDVSWLIGGWADHCLGLKGRGATPVRSEAGGRPDFALEPSVGGEGAGREPFYASDYFEALHAYAVELVRRGKAYVCDLAAEEMERYRGGPERPGTESPYRGRAVEENLDLFARMRAGEYPDGTRTLRAKLDMASPNIWLRDPVLYRIRHAEHHQTGRAWCLYPLYDFAHCLSDYIEGITHSICTLEFEVHRPLYDWILQALDLPRPLPRQHEFARLNLSYTVMSKRKLMALVKKGVVAGWDDPRLPTISGLRRRGVPASALRAFATQVGITKYDGVTEVAVLEHAIREELNRTSQRRLAVLRPLKLVITNLPEDHSERLEAVNNPEAPETGKRAVAFSREIYIERDDFAEVPPPKYYRLKPGGEVRLKYAYIVRCDEVVKDEAGEVVEVRCTADLESKSGGPTSGRKVKGTIHWVSAKEAVDLEVRLYDRLFLVSEPDAEGDFERHLNPDSLEVVMAKGEGSLAGAGAGERFQFERLGYFAPDPDAAPGRAVFNRTIALKDAWAKAVGRVG